MEDRRQRGLNATSLATKLSTTALATTLVGTTALAADSSSYTNAQGYIFSAKNASAVSPQAVTEPIFSAASAQGVRVGLDRHGPVSDLTMQNLVTGEWYAAIAKPTMSEDPFTNSWALISDPFQAPGPAVYFENIPMNRSQRYLASANVSRYVGPSIKVLSPAPNATVTGDVPIKLSVTDILPVTRIEAYIGSQGVGTLTAGKPELTIPSYLAPNGPNEVYFFAVNEGVPTETGDLAQFESFTSIPLNFQNTVVLKNNPALITAAGSLNLEYQTTRPITYDFKVRTLDDQVIFSRNGVAPAGPVPVQWDFSRSDGQSVSGKQYVFEFNYRPQGQFMAASAPGPSIKTTNSLDTGVTVARTMLACTEWESFRIWTDVFNMEKRLWSHLQWQGLLYDDVLGFDREPYFAEPIVVMKESEVNDITYIEESFGRPEVGAFLAVGHGGADQLFAGIDGFITYAMSAGRVATHMGNNILGPHRLAPQYNKRLMYSILSGCSTTGGDWPTVLGTPRGIDQEVNQNIHKSMFFGWKNLVYMNQEHYDFIEAFQYTWASPSDGFSEFEFPSGAVFSAALAQYPTMREAGPTQYGWRKLTYSASDHPHN